jgi:hypothetical protein
MRFDAAGVIHRLLKGLAVSFVENAMGASEDFRAFLLGAGREVMHVAGDFDLLSQWQVLDTADDGFDDGHFAAN